MSRLPDPGALWAEARATVHAEREVLAAISGAFLLLPQLLLARYGGQFLPTTDPGAVPDWPVFLLLLLAVAGQVVGQLFASLLLLCPGPATGGSLLQRALALLPAGLVTSIAQSLCLVPAILLLLMPQMPVRLLGLVALVPGVYLFVRLNLSIAALASGTPGALAALSESFRATAGQVLALLGRLLPVLFGFLLLLMLAGVVATLLSLNSAPTEWGIGRWVGLMLSTIIGAAMTLVLALMLAIMWRALRSGPSRP